MRELFRTVTVVAVTVPVGAVGGTVSAGAEAVGADAAERSAGVGWAADGDPGCGAAALGAPSDRRAISVRRRPRPWPHRVPTGRRGAALRARGASGQPAWPHDRRPARPAPTSAPT